MSRLSKFNVVLFFANVVVAVGLAVTLWRISAGSKSSVGPLPVERRVDRGAVTAPSVEARRVVESPVPLPKPGIVASQEISERLPTDAGASPNVPRHPAERTPVGIESAGAVPSPAASIATIVPSAAPTNTPTNPARSGTITAGGTPPASAEPSPSPSPPADPTSDRTPPVLDSLSFNPPQIEDGATTTLLITVHDDLSGVRHVTGNLRSPGGTAIVTFEGQGESGGNVFVASIAIPKHAETGLWYVTNLFVPDRADNTLIATYTAATAPAGGALRVVSQQSDSTAPEVRGATLEKVAVKDGESDVITVDVEDDVSGVATVSGTFQSFAKSAFIPFACRLNPNSGMWDGSFAIPGNASCGEWTLQQLRVADKAGNIATISGTDPRLSRAGFFVMADGDCDSNAPTIDSFVLSPTVVSNEAPSAITITAQIRDEGTGAISAVGWASGPVGANGQPPQISFSCTRRPTDPQDLWTGRIIVSPYAARGSWQIRRVRVQDKALNTRDYTADDPVLAGVTFEVQ